MHLVNTLKKTLPVLLLAAAPASAVQINLIDIGGVNGSAAEQGFQIAANYWESVLTNDAVLNFNVGYASLGADILGSTKSNSFKDVDIGSYYSLLNATQSSALDAQAVANLSPLTPNGSVDVTVPEYFDPNTLSGVAEVGSRTAPDNTPISGTMAISSANIKALVGGFEDVVDGEINFSSDFAFDFDPTDGISGGMYDFIGVAIHEMAHALGFLSSAQDFDYNTGTDFPVDDYWWGYSSDMFRYSAPGVLDWTFDTDSYFSLDAGATAYMDGYFSTGAVNGDGSQASHWKKNYTCTDFLGIMNPYTCDGFGTNVSALDLALLDAIGWDTNVDITSNPNYLKSSANIYFDAVPEPSVLALMFAGLIGLFGVSRRRQS
ncbi:MAG: hypothetical protein ACI96W_003111 [Paraglaciecola sp.]|jgi:hypothetical protein